jgi:hypothetical protein
MNKIRLLQFAFWFAFALQAEAQTLPTDSLALHRGSIVERVAWADFHFIYLVGISPASSLDMRTDFLATVGSRWVWLVSPTTNCAILYTLREADVVGKRLHYPTPQDIEELVLAKYSQHIVSRTFIVVDTDGAKRAYAPGGELVGFGRRIATSSE